MTAVRCLRIVGWNVVLCTVGAALTAACAEAYLRFATPFLEPRYPYEWVPDVGMLWKPDEEQRHTNQLDYWTTQRANSVGFSDRELPSFDDAAGSCHVAVIGDSFVEAREVVIEAKLQVQLEQLAAQHLPHLEITTSGFGRSGTGQINQLAYYDKYVRRLSPKLVVLVVDRSDFINNSVWLNWLAIGSRHLSTAEDSLPLAYALGAHGRVAPDGTLEILPPIDSSAFDIGAAVPVAGAPGTHGSYLWTRLNAEYRHHGLPAWAARWLATLKQSSGDAPSVREERYMQLQRLGPRFDSLLRNVPPDANHDRLIHSDDPPGLHREALTLSALAFKEFKARTARDSSALVVLTTHLMGTRDSPRFSTLSRIAGNVEAPNGRRGVPVVGLLDYMHRHGVEPPDIQFRHDAHWNEDGHRWAAEALLEYIGKNQGICRQ